jgi:hypothetical protein
MSLTKCLIAIFSRSRSISEARQFFWPEKQVIAVIVLSMVGTLGMLWTFVHETQVARNSIDPDLPLVLALVLLAFTFAGVLALLACLNSKVSTEQYAWCLRQLRLRASLGLPLPQRSMTKRDLLEYAINAKESENYTKMMLSALNRQ